MMPIMNSSISDQIIEAAGSEGLPMVNGKQAVATSRVEKNGVAVNWYHLEDGTEWIADDQGNETEWPE